MLQPPAGLHCTAAHYRTRRNLFRVASTGQTTHTHIRSHAHVLFSRFPFRWFLLQTPVTLSPDRDPILELKTMMIAIVAIYGVALTTRFAEGDDVDVVADTRFFPPAVAPFLPYLALLLLLSRLVCQQVSSSCTSFPTNLRPSVASQCDSRVLQLAVPFFV